MTTQVRSLPYRGALVATLSLSRSQDNTNTYKSYLALLQVRDSWTRFY
jgi:hypothetical protein